MNPARELTEYPAARRIAIVGSMILVLAAWSAAGRAEERPAFPDAKVRAWQTGLLRPDRLQHASLALTSGLSVGLVTQKPAAAAGGAMLLGILKELRDMRHTRFDWTDLAADGIGAGLSAAGTAVFRHP